MKMLVVKDTDCENIHLLNILKTDDNADSGEQFNEDYYYCVLI